MVNETIDGHPHDEIDEKSIFQVVKGHILDISLWLGAAQGYPVGQEVFDDHKTEEDVKVDKHMVSYIKRFMFNSKRGRVCVKKRRQDADQNVNVLASNGKGSLVADHHKLKVVACLRALDLIKRSFKILGCIIIK